MDGDGPVVVEDRESLDGLCGDKDDLENEMIRAKAELTQKEEDKAKGKDWVILIFSLEIYGSQLVTQVYKSSLAF